MVVRFIFFFLISLFFVSCDFNSPYDLEPSVEITKKPTETAPETPPQTLTQMI